MGDTLRSVSGQEQDSVCEKHDPACKFEATKRGNDSEMMGIED